MARVVQAGGFYVVGGPVQPDRACYVAREADDELAQCIAEQRFCYVLAPRASGKSSLMARTIKTLRGEGQLAAVVDLSQLAVRDGTDAGRWYYSIAYRIGRELRLKADLQSWWQEKSALMSEQRLAEFFWEIVLANTTVPVTIFFDGIERAVRLPFAQELYSAIRACYTRRATEPDYGRLSFVVLGSAPHTQLCPDLSVSPFTEGQAIDLPDFTLEETYRLGAGLGLGREQARAVMAEIQSWAGGQPYLTQKVARAVARKGAASSDVERVVRELLLAPGVTREEPLLSHIRGMLTESAPASRQALVLLDKISRGVEVYDDRASAGHAWLHMTGVVAAGPGGRLHYRNRLYRMLFTSRWARAVLPFNWKSAAAAAAVIAALVVVPLWYTYYLPRPYVRTLSVVTQDIAVAEDAYEKLRRLPGFARTADDLLAEAMARRARQAGSFAEVRAAADAVRGLPQRAGYAEELMSEFWLRRARDSMHAEQRDAALLYALHALPSRETEALAALAELVGEDYRHLERSYRFSAAPAHWDVDWDSGALTLIDRTHRAERLPLPSPGDRNAQHVTPSRGVAQLTALQHVPLRRELSVERAGTAGAFELQLSVHHPGVTDLSVTLEAPSGASAVLPLPRRGAELLDHTVSAVAGSPLAALAREERQGVWRLTLVDGRIGDVGTLLSWGIRFAGGVAAWDEPEQGIAIPDPSRTGQVEVSLAVGGRVAAARSVRPGTVGALALWDLVNGRLTGDVPTPAALAHLAFTRNGERLLTVAGNEVALWDAHAATPIARMATQGELALPPALGVDGRYLALAERAPGRAGLRTQLLHADSGLQVARGEGLLGTTDWVLGAQARYVAAVGPARVVRIIDPRRGTTLRELRHERDVVRLIAGIEGDVLLTVDSAGDIHAWPIEALPAGDARAPGRRLGSTADPASVSLSADGSTLAFEAPQGYVVALQVDGHGAPYRFRIDRAGAPVGTRLSPAGRRLLTANGPLLRLWRLERTPVSSAVHPDLTALALDSQGRFVALGFQGGHVRMRAATELDRPADAAPAVDYIGHRGAVAVLALDAEHGLIASGGTDGAIRVWDTTTVAPQPHFMRHPEGPVRALALSSDGVHVASAAEYSARIWRVADGGLEAEVPVNGSALAVEFSADAALLAVGDSAGNVFIAPSFGAAPALSARAQGPVRALAFAPHGRVLASGDESGHIHLWDAASAEQLGEPYAFPHPVAWLRFSAEGDQLVVQTDHWIHRLAVEAGRLRAVESRLPNAGSRDGIAFADPRGDRLRLLGGLAAGSPMLHELDLGSPEAAAFSVSSPVLTRDWQRVLGLSVGSAGEVTPLYR